MHLAPVTLLDAKAWVNAHHRHNEAPVGWKFGVALMSGDEMVGVAMAGRTVAKGLHGPTVGEVTRVCTLGAKNANTMLYGAIARAAQALGYRTLYTYTLEEESGASLLAAGWERDAYLPARESWDTPTRPRHQERRPTGAKWRWIKRLTQRELNTSKEIANA